MPQNQETEFQVVTRQIAQTQRHLTHHTDSYVQYHETDYTHYCPLLHTKTDYTPSASHTLMAYSTMLITNTQKEYGRLYKRD